MLMPRDEGLAGTIKIFALSSRAILMNELGDCVVGQVLGHRWQVDFFRGHKLAIPK